jgi:hypothetical protein
VTFILNILHNDMSLLAADRKAMEVQPYATAAPGVMVPAATSFPMDGFRKITLNQSGSLAVGIAGLTHEHHYTQAIERSASVDEALWSIRNHVNGFLRIHDRANLIASRSFVANQGIASFFDSGAGTFFSMEYRFSPVHCSTRLHGARDGARLLHAGSGSEYFEKVVGAAEVESFIASINDSCTPEACIHWVQNAFKRVSASDAGSGDDPVFAVSTRSNPQFR